MTPLPGRAEPTLPHERGIFRKRPMTLLGECIKLMEVMHMESLNGVLCQCDDTRCKGCQGHWRKLTELVNRYDEGER